MFSFGIGRTKPTSGSIFGHGFGHSQETVGIWQNPIAEFGYASAEDFGVRVAPTWPWVAVRCHNIAAVWVAFLPRQQRYCR